MSDFLNSELSNNFNENFNSFNEGSLNPDYIQVQIQSNDCSSMRLLKFSQDDDGSTDGCLVSIDESSDKYVLGTDDSIELGMWLVTRDYSVRKLINWADQCAQIIYDRIMCLPKELRSIGYDESLLVDTVLDDVLYPSDYKHHYPSDLQLSQDNRDRLVELINSNLRDCGINVEGRLNTSRGIAVFLRGTTMFPNIYHAW